MVCEYCGRKFWACRIDTKFCSNSGPGNCRDKVRYEDKKFNLGEFKKSNIIGITWSRWREQWEVKIHVNGDGPKKLKYIGQRKTLEEAIKLREEILK